MVVGSTTVKPGEIGTLKVSVMMHEGMGGPHLFHIFVKSSDPEKPVTILNVKADIVPLDTWRGSHPNAFYLPRDVAGFKLRSESVGIDVIDQSYKVFGYPGQLRYGYVGSYKNYKKETRLLVSEYTDAEKAKELFSEMIGWIKKGARAPDKLMKREVVGNPVYSLKKGVNEHFYFQSDNKVVLLFPDSSVVMQSLEEVLKHIQAL